jgi:hypothetical protein|tara:strand:- start:936 stop:1154 length:219 start_codon:yes stop_codon:yes gene_type:complete
MAKVTVTTIAQATKCAAKVKAGKPCTQAELRSTVLLLNEAQKSSRRSLAFARKQVAEKTQMVSELLGSVLRR